MSKRCGRCYETDDFGQITKFLCSRYGWTPGMARCQCKHHEGDVSLYGQLLAPAVRAA